MSRLYIIPQDKIPLTPGRFYYCPRHFPHRFNPALPGLEGVDWTWQTQALGDIALLAADVTDVQHFLLLAQPDIGSIPDDLTTPVSAGDLQLFQRLFVTGNVPNDIVQLDRPYRQVVREFLDTVHFHNPLVGKLARPLFQSGATLSTVLRDAFSAAERATIFTTMDAGGISRTGVTNTTSCEALLMQGRDTLTARRGTQAYALRERIL